MDKQPASILIKGLFKSISVLLFLTASDLYAASSFILPPNHQSTYDIEKYGTHVGEMNNQLKNHNGKITYTSTARASGFASLFVKENPVETSILNWSESPSKPPLQQSYQLHNGKKHKKNQNITFKQTSNGDIKIQGSYKKKPYEIISTNTVWSRQLLPLLMSNDLQLDSKNTGNSYQITDRGSLQKYTYTLEKTENIQINGKSYPSLKFKISRQDSKRMSYAWLSSAHYYLPVQIEQYKDGKLHVSMRMKQFKETP